ncbi:bifunctional hydroxymethylpyrimidine kinase/phosphomethylpyrimidine kinase [Candidatus Sumerlaeota bacterium]|nr:bifunctional hydroxymethylpyrimidine kinase/phosphomethylpyrimidine kinase [Candidatus Sumerlaeota bacterium]
MKQSPHIALTIAGSDSGGGAGIQADLKTFMALGVHGCGVITALTAQNSREVAAVWLPPGKIVYKQLKAVMTDMGADAAKTGMLGNGEIVDAVVRGLRRWPVRKLVVDPVMIATSGGALLDPAALNHFKRKLIPMAFLLTPNIPEAESLTGIKIRSEEDIWRAAESLRAMGAQNILIKGGHARDRKQCKDWFLDGRKKLVYSASRVRTKNTHGSGCTLSAAITALLARRGKLESAIAEAKEFVTRALESSYRVGSGPGPLDHGWAFQPGGFDPMIIIVDYGMGNLRSVNKALDHLGIANKISSDARDIEKADRLILPGVGAFGECVRGVRSRGLERPILDYVATGRPFLGICVGMQILAETSEESPEERGLGIIAGSVPRFKGGLKIPHMGWNNLRSRADSRLFKDIPEDSYFYFVHSFFVRPEGKDGGAVCATCEYGETFPAAIERDNIFATQFHPEKSQTWGLKLLGNFSSQ